MGKYVRRGVLAQQRALAMLNNGRTLDEIADATGFSQGYVRQLGAKNGVKVKRRLTVLQQSVKDLRLQGLCSSEIADLLNKRTCNINHIANVIGMPFTDEERARSIEIGYKKNHAHQHVAASDNAYQFITDNFPDWCYVSGYVHADGFMELRHKVCGTVVQKSCCTIRHRRKITCPACQAQRIQKRKQEQEQEKERQAKEAEKAKERQFWSRDFKQKAFLVCSCKECGVQFISQRNNTKYCSDECRKKHLNRTSDHRLDRADKKNSDITLRKLYNRDNGICWICGEKCNYSDHTKDPNGNFIVGRTYPSIDHVYPLSKGGSHTWDNVRLAHWWCNTLKSDKVVS